MLKTLIGNSLADGSRLVHVNNQGRAELHLGQIIMCHTSGGDIQAVNWSRR